MNMKSKLLTALACASCAATLFGTATDVPVVSDVTFNQPGGGRTVTVTYNLQYAPAIVTVDVLTNGVSIGAENIVSFEGDVGKVVQPGARQFKWFAKRDWPDHLITENIVSVKLRAWSLAEPPPYMVADLETPSNVTYYASVDALPDGGLSNRLYKAARLVMRRIDAVGVRWNMGTHPTEIGYQKDTALYVAREKIHPAQLTNDYYIGIYPLTRGQFKRIAGFAPSQTDAPSGADDEIYSVQWVAYSEMRQVAPENSTSTSQTNHAYDWPAAPAPESYLGRLSSLTGVAFDLPGEGEWEYACRAGNYSGFWGDGSVILSSGSDANLTRLANYHGGSNGTADKCLPVGIYEPNAWGLYDMHGNLWELCLDIYVDDISALNGAINTTQIASQSVDSSKGIRHTDRGGARHKDAQYCRSSFRDRDPEAGRSGGVGFRLVSRIAQ